MEFTKIAVDAMGGDHAPAAIVEGCVQAVLANSEIKILLVGEQTAVSAELSKYTFDKTRIEVIHAPDVITNEESPVLAIRRKKDSSLVKALQLVRDKEAEAIVSAGSTGAVLAGGTFIVGRIKGIERPALGSLIPNKKGVALIIDCGANVDSKPQYLVQFARMGSVYYESFVGIDNPKVGLANIGTEEAKGNHLTKEVFPLLKEDKTFNFIGNVEAREIPSGDVHVIVCDGFVGNIILKYTEGLAMSLLSMIKKALMSTTLSKIGALLSKPALKRMMKEFDYTEYGGAPLLGLEGLVVKTHGSSNAKVIKNAIFQCKTFSDKNVNEKIKQKILS